MNHEPKPSRWSVPALRITACSDQPARPDGQYVLYWMTASRRTGWNFGLQRAVEWARSLKRPLLVLEALRCDYPWASERFHTFVVQGMADNAADFSRQKGALYYPYVERNPGDGSGLLEALAEPAAVVIVDEFPSFFLPRMIAAASARVPVRMERVDSNGLLPLRAAPKVFPTAYAFRRFLHKALPLHLGDPPLENPLARSGVEAVSKLPAGVRRRWPAVGAGVLDDGDGAVRRLVGKLPIDRTVGEVARRGGSRAARQRLGAFLGQGLDCYLEDRNQPERDGTSRLSDYLHFGHLSAHEVFQGVAQREDWSPASLAERATGKRSGWWGMGEAAESFLDQIVTWREVGYNMCAGQPGFDRYDSLPSWARTTLREHESDPRRYVYDLDHFATGRTHDPLWNAAQMQLVREGRIHNYLRMLWGKKILEWTRSPQDALEVMIELNNRYALDGRNPNSYSGIFWVLGRYDRAWGPERPIFGKIRYMSSENTARKIRVRGFIESYAP